MGTGLAPSRAVPAHQTLTHSPGGVGWVLHSMRAIAGDLAHHHSGEGHRGAQRPQVPPGLPHLLLLLLVVCREAEPMPLAFSTPDGDAGGQPDGTQQGAQLWGLGAAGLPGPWGRWQELCQPQGRQRAARPLAPHRGAPRLPAVPAGGCGTRLPLGLLARVQHLHLGPDPAPGGVQLGGSQSGARLTTRPRLAARGPPRLDLHQGSAGERRQQPVHADLRRAASLPLCQGLRALEAGRGLGLVPGLAAGPCRGRAEWGWLWGWSWRWAVGAAGSSPGWLGSGERPVLRQRRVGRCWHAAGCRGGALGLGQDGVGAGDLARTQGQRWGRAPGLHSGTAPATAPTAAPAQERQSWGRFGAGQGLCSAWAGSESCPRVRGGCSGCTRAAAGTGPSSPTQPCGITRGTQGWELFQLPNNALSSCSKHPDPSCPSPRRGRGCEDPRAQPQPAELPPRPHAQEEGKPGVCGAQEGPGGCHLSVPRARGRVLLQDGNRALSPGVDGAGFGLLVLLPGATFQLRVPLVPRLEAPLDHLQQGVPRLAHGEGHALRAQDPPRCPVRWQRAAGTGARTVTPGSPRPRGHRARGPRGRRPRRPAGGAGLPTCRAR